MEELFEDYCKRKKIDPIKFKAGDPEKYREWQIVFEQIHPDSFTAQKLYLINDIRRRFHYDVMVEKPAKSPQTENPRQETTSVSSSAPKPAIGKPKIPTATTAEVSNTPKPKPVIGKPKIPVKKAVEEQPENTTPLEENKTVSKPKPVIPGIKKPVIPTKDKTENSVEETVKPKAVIPKPKIPAKPSAVEDKKEETPEPAPRPKPKLAVKIPPKKKEE